MFVQNSDWPRIPVHTVTPCASQVSGRLYLAGGTPVGEALFATNCYSCNEATIWKQAVGGPDEPVPDAPPNHESGHSTQAHGAPTFSMIWPQTPLAPEPNPDLPHEVLEDYEEARAVLLFSPRAAAALLRLALQRLCVHFGKPGKNINDDIGALVAEGTVRPMVQKAMDTIRISGNESVHPGELNVSDDEGLARALFEFINLIAQETITVPAMVDRAYDRMPADKREAVSKRDRLPKSD